MSHNDEGRLHLPTETEPIYYRHGPNSDGVYTTWKTETRKYIVKDPITGEDVIYSSILTIRVIDTA